MYTTRYFDDFLLYYKKAEILEKRNFSILPPDTKCDDPLMDHITIYDTIHRKYAGFSNMLQQVWYGSSNPKVHQRVPEFDELKHKWDRTTWLYVFLVHRLTGSGASFQHDHGFRNTILPTLARQCSEIDCMTEVIRKWSVPMYTSIGNQIPAFPKPKDGYANGGKYYLCELTPHMARDLMQWFDSNGGTKGIREVVDWCLDWNTEHGCKRFKFVMTAFVMDIAEYMPDLVDPRSHANYGKNAMESLDLMYSPEAGESRNAAFYDKAMDHLCQTVGGMPYDVEDVLCDSIRYWENYIPKGYSHLTLDQIQTRTTIVGHPKHPSYEGHVTVPKEIIKQTAKLF